MFNFATAVHIRKNIIISSKTFFMLIIIFIVLFDEDILTSPFSLAFSNIFKNFLIISFPASSFSFALISILIVSICFNFGLNIFFGLISSSFSFSFSIINSFSLFSWIAWIFVWIFPKIFCCSYITLFNSIFSFNKILNSLLFNLLNSLK